MSESSRARLRSLQAQREALEIEAQCLADALNSPGANGEPPAGIKTPLVDSEGFPRADVDIMYVRTQRNRLAVLNTDHKALMKQIEAELAVLHDLSGNVTPQASSAGSAVVAAPRSSFGNKPFAIIDEVLDGSPSHQAGIQNGDELVAFGSIRAETLDGLNCIPALVGANVNKPITIEVRRRQAAAPTTTTAAAAAAPSAPAASAPESASTSEVPPVPTHTDAAVLRLQLTLQPRPWGGRGLLGCHLTPLP